jgi:hypothetical protein
MQNELEQLRAEEEMVKETRELSLTFWGMIWGIPGMFLSVPFMVVIAIICARFEGLRVISVVLCADVDLLASNTNRK